MKPLHTCTVCNSQAHPGEHCRGDVGLSRTEYMDPSEGWEQYRSESTLARALWHVERLDEPFTTFAVVERENSYTIARRRSFAHSN